MTANHSKSYLLYWNSLNELVDEYNNTYHHSINKKTINVDYSASTEKILKLLTLKSVIELEWLSIKIFLVKVTLKIGQEKYLLLILLSVDFEVQLIVGLIKLKI